MIMRSVSIWLSKIPGMRGFAYLCMVACPCAAGLAQATTVTFTTPGYPTWTVPNGVTSLHIVASGGDGGPGGGAGALGGQGGAGCIVEVTGLAVHPGDVLSLVVGGAGVAGSVGPDGFGGGGGGGATSINAGLANQIIAGGGGGGGGYGTYVIGTAPPASSYGGAGGLCGGTLIGSTSGPFHPVTLADGASGGTGSFAGQGGRGGAGGLGGAAGAGGVDAGYGHGAGGAGINGAGTSATLGYGGGGGNGGFGGGVPIYAGAGGPGGLGALGYYGTRGVGSGSGGGGFGGYGGPGGGGGGGGGGFGGGGGGGNGTLDNLMNFQGGGGGGSGGSTGPAGAKYYPLNFTAAGNDGSIVLTYVGPPVVTTDAGSTAFVAGDNTASTPVVVDAGVTVTADTPTLQSATIAITGNLQSGEDVLAFANDGATMGNIAGSYNAATGMLTMTSSGSSATVAQWQSALQSVTYTDTAITPANATRTVSFSVVDANSNASNIATRTVTVADTDQTPIVTTTSGATNYVSGATAVLIDTGVTVSDRDNTTQSSGTVAITGGFVSGSDLLAFTNISSATFGNIVGSYNSATGVLTLTSSGATASNTQWQNSFSTVRFSTASTSPGTRTASFTVNDGTKSSAAATKSLNVATGQTITFLAPGATTLAAGTINVNPTASSGLPVTLISNSPLVCTVGGAGPFTIALVGAGNCSLTATQAGNTSYTAATPVTVSFAVGKVATAIAITGTSPSGGVTLGQSVTISVSVAGTTTPASVGVAKHAASHSTSAASGAVPAALAVPTGSVTITDVTGSPSTCTATLSNGTASCTVTPSAIGSNTVQAVYGGDANYAPSAQPAIITLAVAVPPPNVPVPMLGRWALLQLGSLVLLVAYRLRWRARQSAAPAARASRGRA